MTPEPQATALLEIRLFGSFEVLSGGEPMPALRSKREQWLLALLVLRGVHDTSRRWLATTLWPDNDEDQGLFYLRKALSNLRRALGKEGARILSPSPGSVRLDMKDAFADVLQFDLRTSRQATPDQLMEAVELYRGPLLPGCQEEWAVQERGARETAYLAALEALSSRSDSVTSVRWLRLLVSADPYRESAYRALMQALSDCGDRAAVSIVYRELRERLFNDLNSSPSPETESLFAALRKREPREVAPPSAPADPRRHLPVPLTDLIGRKSEIEDVRSWIKVRRLVTLVGAGGIGKTRLSIAAAEAVLPAFEGGAWFVDLGPLSSPAMVATTMAKALGIPEEPMVPMTETLVRGIGARRILVVLDNCEHLIEACAEIVERLLSACPNATVLATSRQPLHVPGEQVFRVPGLPVPPVEEPAVEGSLLSYEAIRLFVDRGVRADPAFQLVGRNARSVVEICRQLDGIPLAIELSAARIRSMSVNEVCERLDRRFQLLKAGGRVTVPRQQTLRSLIDWSYDLLGDQEKALLGRIAVFAGGWTLEAAEQVCHDATIEQSEVLDVLSSLVDKSLAIRESRESESRYRLLETVKQYAIERLAEHAEEGLWRDRHLAHFLSLAEEAEPNLIGAGDTVWQARLETEHDNLREALAWATASESRADSGLRLCGALLYFWLGHGHYNEGVSLCEAALAQGDPDSDRQARAATLHCAGRLAYAQGDNPLACRLGEECLSLSRDLGDLKWVTQALNLLGLVAFDEGRYGVARSYHAESLSLRRTLGDGWTISQSLNNLGCVETAEGHFERARELLEESIAIRRQMGLRHGTAIALDSLAEATFEQGDYGSAEQLWKEALGIQLEIGDHARACKALAGLGVIAGERGEFALSKQFLKESLEIWRGPRTQGGHAALLEAYAHIGSMESSHERAARLWGAASMVRESQGTGTSVTEVARRDARVGFAREALGDDTAFEMAWAEGRAMSLEEALSYAAGG